MKSILFMFLVFVPGLILSQSLRLVQDPVVKYTANMVLFAPQIEPHSEKGVFFSQQKTSQFLNIFDINAQDFLVKTISTARKKTSPSSFITQESDEVVFFASLYYKKNKRQKNLLSFRKKRTANDRKSTTYLCYAFVNENGKTQIQTIADTDNWTAKENKKSAEFKYINYPVITKLAGKLLSIASTDKGIVYNYSNKSFSAMELIPNASNNGSQIFTAPVLSPSGKYLAFLELNMAQNKSVIHILKIKIENGIIQFRNLLKIDHGRNVHCKSPSFSRDESKVAFFSNKGSGGDLYSIYYRNLPKGKRDVLVARESLPNTILSHGPAWLNNNIILYVKHSSREEYPIYYKDLTTGKTYNLNTGTIMNKDLVVWQKGDLYKLLYISIGNKKDGSLTKNKIYLAKLKPIK